MSESSKRFQCIPRGYEGGCIYAVELENGCVKVGRSLNPRTRMVGLRKEVRRTFACDLTRFYIGPDLACWRTAGRAEQTLLAHLSAEGRLAKPGLTEFFAGISYERARALAEAVSLTFLKPTQRCVEGADPSASEVLSLHGLQHAQPSYSTPLI